MRSRLLSKRIVTHSIAMLVGIAIGWLAMPVWREAVMHWNQDAYGQLVEQCDTAMRDHFQAKQSEALGASDKAGRELAAAEMGLIICQDYDLYQKRLMQWGLRENELATMRLKAIEARATDLDEVVATHEISF